MTRKQADSGQTKTCRVAAYVRVSTDEQAASGLGIQAQIERCGAMATVKGWLTPTLYADEGISGTKDATQRPGLQRLLTDARAGKIDAVIILSLDRLGRKTRLVLDLVEELSASGVTLVSCKESLDTESATGKFVLSLFAALAQLERDQTGERTKAALREKSRRDGDAGGKMPYGYVRQANGISVDEEAARWVRYIFNARKRGDSLREIAAKLTQQGIAGPRGGAWHHTGVAAVLANKEAYRGHNRGLSDFRWPSVL